MLKGNYTYVPSGVDESWETHGSIRLSNASYEWKNWLKSIESTWIGYGIHAYHHDYPWPNWEFHLVTNTTWINATWNQICQDVSAIGLKNQTWFKPPGFRMQPQGLDVLTEHGIEGCNVNYEEPPAATAWYFYVDTSGRKLILFTDNLSPDDLFSPSYFYNYSLSPSFFYNNMVKGNLTSLGLLSMTGHFINQTVYPQWDELFKMIKNDFDFDYFLVDEIIDYWHNVLMPLKYTYNSTQITSNIDDSRLTFKLTNSSIKVTSGLRYDDSAFTLYCPNIQTGNLLLKRLSGYATISDATYSTNSISFTVSAPNDTISLTELYMGNIGLPTTIFMNNTGYVSPSNTKHEFNSSSHDAWYYDFNASVLFIRGRHSGPLSVIIDFTPSKTISVSPAQAHTYSTNMTLQARLLPNWDFSDTVVMSTAIEIQKPHTHAILFSVVET